MSIGADFVAKMNLLRMEEVMRRHLAAREMDHTPRGRKVRARLEDLVCLVSTAAAERTLWHAGKTLAAGAALFHRLGRTAIYATARHGITPFIARGDRNVCANVLELLCLSMENATAPEADTTLDVPVISTVGFDDDARVVNVTKHLRRLVEKVHNEVGDSLDDGLW